MAYTIKEVEKKTGISAHTLRFWAREGLFSHLDRDENQVRYFSETDIAWVGLVHCLRHSGMSLARIKEYIELTKLGEGTLEERIELFKAHKADILEVITRYELALERIDMKIGLLKDALEKRDEDIVPGKNKRLQNYAKTQSKYKSLKDNKGFQKRVPK